MYQILNDARISVKKLDVVSPEAPIPQYVKPESREPSLGRRSTNIDVWTLREGYDATRYNLNSDAVIDQLKQLVFNGQNESHLYRAYFLNRQLRPGDIVPQNTASEQPVILRKISAPNNDIAGQESVNKYSNIIYIV